MRSLSYLLFKKPKKVDDFIAVVKKEIFFDNEVIIDKKEIINMKKIPCFYIENISELIEVEYNFHLGLETHQPKYGNIERLYFNSFDFEKDRKKLEKAGFKIKINE